MAGKKRKPKSKLEDKEQSRRFVETARKLGADDSGEAFERVTRKLIKKKPQTSTR